MSKKGKHVSFPNQREQCRLNKYTYTEKCACGILTLMCNYPFEDPKHKKGICRANTCTDMRKTLAGDVDAIEETMAPSTEEKLGDDALIDAKDNIASDTEPEKYLSDPEDIAKSA